MRRGWLAKINMINDAAIFSNTNENESDPAGDNINKNLLRSNSRSKYCFQNFLILYNLF